MEARDPDGALSAWDAQKRKEKGQSTAGDAMDSVARALPALTRAAKLQSKAAKAGFDWREVSPALDKLSEELEEFRTAVREDSNVEEELGDLLFAAVKAGRFAGVDSEAAAGGLREVHPPLPRRGGAGGGAAGRPGRARAGGALAQGEGTGDLTPEGCVPAAQETARPIEGAGRRSTAVDTDRQRVLSIYFQAACGLSNQMHRRRKHEQD